MDIKISLFEPKVSFLNKTHHIPKKEEYTYTKKIEGVKNTPVAPSFGKKFFHALTTLFHKIEIKFLIRNIKNNKLSSVVDINKHNNFFNDVDNEESKKPDDSCSINSNSEGCFSQDEIKNKNLEAIKNIISHANDKFDFYSFCDYLTEIKRAKDFFSSLNDVAGGECSDSKLIVDLLNKIAINRIKAIDDKSIKNVFKLVSLKFDFENVNLNKKYDFMHNFSSLKERDKFIRALNFLVIAQDKVDIDIETIFNQKNKLSFILKTILNVNEEISLKQLIEEYKKIYIDNECDFYSDNTQSVILDNNSDDVSIDILFDSLGGLEKLLDEKIDVSESVKVDPESNSEVNKKTSLLSNEVITNEDVENGDIKKGGKFLNNIKGNLEDVKNIFDNYEKKNKELSEFIDSMLDKDTNIEQKQYDEIKQKFSDVLSNLENIDFEEKNILNSLKLDSDVYKNIDIDIKILNESLEDFNSVLNKQNLDNLQILESSLIENAGDLPNILKTMRTLTLQEQKVKINEFIKSLDDIYVKLKNNLSNVELNIMDKSNNREKIELKTAPVFYKNKVADTYSSDDVDNIDNIVIDKNINNSKILDDLYSSLEVQVNHVSKELKNISEKFNLNLVSNRDSNISAVDKVNELRNKYAKKNNDKTMDVESYNINSKYSTINDKLNDRANQIKLMEENLSKIQEKNKINRLEVSKLLESEINSESKEKIINVVEDAVENTEVKVNNDSNKNSNKKTQEYLKDKGNNRGKNYNKLDESYIGKLRKEHEASSEIVGNFEVKNDILVFDNNVKNKNIENIRFNYKEKRITFLKVIYDNKKVAIHINSLMSDEDIKKIENNIKGKESISVGSKMELRPLLGKIVNEINQYLTKK
ncbi:MAG: hypothetical protein SO066_10760 [Proteus mirabilis]|nr:hypothetical protein [Proteus mirabilis]